jgi:hypothetical protein
MKTFGWLPTILTAQVPALLFGSCSVPPQQGPAKVGSLSFRYEVDDKRSLHYRGHANASAETGVIQAYLSQVSHHANTRPTVQLSERYPIAFQAGTGECFRFGVTKLWSHYEVADDWAEWEILLASEGRLVDDLKRGGKGCKLIAVYRSANPPDSLLIADEFTSVRTARQGDMLAFELKWKKLNPESVFSAGNGRVVGRIKAE